MEQSSIMVKLVATVVELNITSTLNLQPTLIPHSDKRFCGSFQTFASIQLSFQNYEDNPKLQQSSQLLTKQILQNFNLLLHINNPTLNTNLITTTTIPNISRLRISKAENKTLNGAKRIYSERI